MSFVIAFAPFLRVAVEDDAGAPVTAFRFTPTSAARKAMADHQIVMREDGAGFTLYYKSNPVVAPSLQGAIASRTRFSFAMALNQNDFFDRHFPDFAGGEAQILLDNLDGAGAILTSGSLAAAATVEAAELIGAGPTIHPATVDAVAGAPLVVEARNRFSGAVVGSTDISPEAAGATTLFTFVDTGASPDRAVRLAAPAPSTLDRVVYADDEIADAGAAGVIDLYWDQPQDAVPAGTGAVFTIVFRRRP